jgi:hypothetical protein
MPSFDIQLQPAPQLVRIVRNNIAEACTQARELHPDAKLLRVHDLETDDVEEIVGFCQACRQVILDSMDHVSDEEVGWWHTRCAGMQQA